MRTSAERDCSGILLVDKPAGMTSHDVVDFIRRNFNIAKVGHAGTLDPLATGLLVMLLGRATKKSAAFLNQDKEYRAALRLGEMRDTGDEEGKIIVKKEVPPISDERIREVFQGFLGEQEQIPPMYSSIRHRGKKLYQLARQGKVVKRFPRKINIKELQVEDIALPQISFRLLASKGTYVRTLVEDIGRALGPGATLIELQRSRSGEFSLAQAIAWEKLGRLSRSDLAGYLL